MSSRIDSNGARALTRGERQLIYAAGAGDEEQVMRLIEGGVDVNATHPDRGYTPLHLAAAEGHNEICSLLVQHGARVNALAFGKQPLFLAALGKHDETMALLVRLGADVNLRNSNGKSLLVDAAGQGRFGMLALFLRQFGADGEFLKEDAEERLPTEEYEIVCGIVDSGGADDDIEEDDIFDGYEAVTVLQLRQGDLCRAASNGDDGLVEFLLDEGVSIEATDSWGTSAVYHAAMNGHKSTIELLVSLGADTEPKNWISQGVHARLMDLLE
eukprot:scaffold1312_cov264-Pinguiococcus_pyrenoidosus.AAC.4